MIKTYSELILIPDYIGRFNYLKLGGQIGMETFGFDRYLNQVFYMSSEWREAKKIAILRDNGCDLGIEERIIPGRVIVHHINPITEEDILNREEWIYDPEFLITTSIRTHNAIHYGDESLLILEPQIRTKNDTCPWRK